MMKRLIICVMLLVTVCHSFLLAQTDAAKFIFGNELKGQMSGLQDKGALTIGDKLPAYYFDKQYNSKTLKGKLVVLNYWATWCGGCRLLCADLDSLMIKSSDDYKDVVILGVDCLENLANKGYTPEGFWKEKKFGYPMVGGKGADKLCNDVKAGHPCAMVIDEKGIIRGRWDGWSPSTASEIRFFVWSMHVASKQKVEPTLESVNMLLSKHYYLEALYVLSLMPENEQTSLLKFKAQIYENEFQASDVGQNILVKYKASKDFYLLARNMASAILESGTTNSYLLKVGMDAAGKAAYDKNATVEDHQMVALLRWKYGAAMQQEALAAMETNIKMAKQDKPSFVSKIEHDLNEYKLKTPCADKESSNERMVNVKKDEQDRMKIQNLK